MDLMRVIKNVQTYKHCTLDEIEGIVKKIY